jgi:anti-sigma regulatory factor (Ser/Thr protein kinase)
VVTELVTNAVRHGQGEIVVHLEQAGEGVRGYVQDEGEGFAAARRSDPEQIGGWGLDIVRQLTTTFHTGGSPTRVSFTVAAS